MDFVVSKVAMSICALMVVAILGGMFGEGALLDPRGELENIVDDLCSVVDLIALSRAECRITWQVPFTSGGDAVLIQLDGALIRADSSSERAVGQPVHAVRTWVYDGRALNATTLAELDGTSTALEARSGQSMVLESKLVTIENQRRMFVFASSHS